MEPFTASLLGQRGACLRLAEPGLTPGNGRLALNGGLSHSACHNFLRGSCFSCALLWKRLLEEHTSSEEVKIVNLSIKRLCFRTQTCLAQSESFSPMAGHIKMGLFADSCVSAGQQDACYKVHTSVLSLRLYEGSVGVVSDL